jgi:hypothetical protein
MNGTKWRSRAFWLVVQERQNRSIYQKISVNPGRSESRFARRIKHVFWFLPKPWRTQNRFDPEMIFYERNKMGVQNNDRSRSHNRETHNFSNGNAHRHVYLVQSTCLLFLVIGVSRLICPNSNVNR